MLFLYEIKGWDSWCSIFQDIEAFRGLIEFIFHKHNLEMMEIKNLKAGSNASFLIGNKVIKIFAPKETEFDTELDYKQEIFGVKYANSLGIKSYHLDYFGEVLDKYLFRYMIYDYIDGDMVCDVIDSFNHLDKVCFVNKLNTLLNDLNKPVDFFYHYDPVLKSLTNVRWNNIPNRLREEAFLELKKVKPKNLVYCHNDITGDNTLWKNKEIYLIDFADGNIAPVICEYTTILFDLFNFDQELIGEFRKTHCLDDLFDGILMHEYGYLFLTWITEKILKKSIDCVSLKEIKEGLGQFISQCK